jgi:hypothetical protein
MHIDNFDRSSLTVKFTRFQLARPTHLLRYSLRGALLQSLTMEGDGFAEFEKQLAQEKAERKAAKRARHNDDDGGHSKSDKHKKKHKKHGKKEKKQETNHEDDVKKRGREEEDGWVTALGSSETGDERKSKARAARYVCVFVF